MSLASLSLLAEDTMCDLILKAIELPLQLMATLATELGLVVGVAVLSYSIK